MAGQVPHPPIRMFQAAQAKYIREHFPDQFPEAAADILPEQNKAIQFIIDCVHLPSFPIFVGYLTMVLLSRLYSRFTSPLPLKWILVVYNAICVALSIIATGILCYGVYEERSLFRRTHNNYVKSGMYIYYISKNVELLDTVFMVLRHKHRQISFLQVYHHSSVLILGNYAYLYAPWSPVGALLGLNSFVHICLYSYYFSTALTGGASLTWKKRLTQLQMAQFIAAFFHACWGYKYYTFCVYGPFYCVIMFGLFANFYYHAYVKVRSEKARPKED